MWLLESPWVPIGHAAELFGIATLLLGIAFVVLPLLLSRGGASILAWLSGCLLGLSFGVQGVHIYRSALAGKAVDTDLFMPMFYLQVVLLPLVLICMFTRRRGKSLSSSNDRLAYGVPGGAGDRIPRALASYPSSPARCGRSRGPAPQRCGGGACGTLTVGSPDPDRAMTAKEGSRPEFDSRCTVNAGTWT